MIVKKTDFRIQKGAWGEGRMLVELNGKPTEFSVRVGFRSIFEKARKSKFSKVLFLPLGISEGFPPIAVAKIVAQEVLRFCREYPGAIKELVLVMEDAKTLALFKKQVYGYLRHVQEDLGCGPYCTVDMIIEYKGGIVVIERTNPPFGFALPGGFVDNGESLEHAAIRETKEETNLDLVNLKQFHTYSDPRRDPRFQTISTVFTAKGKGTLRFGDDAKGTKVIPAHEILNHDFAFDHKQILRDYLKIRGKS